METDMHNDAITRRSLISTAASISTAAALSTLPAPAGPAADPCWTEAQNDYWRVSDKMDDTALALLDIVPTSLAGAVALLNYAAVHSSEDKGWMWPWGGHIGR
jgi:hypothetical protein